MNKFKGYQLELILNTHMRFLFNIIFIYMDIKKKNNTLKVMLLQCSIWVRIK